MVYKDKQIKRKKQMIPRTLQYILTCVRVEDKKGKSGRSDSDVSVVADVKCGPCRSGNISTSAYRDAQKYIRVGSREPLCNI